MFGMKGERVRVKWEKGMDTQNNRAWRGDQCAKNTEYQIEKDQIREIRNLKEEGQLKYHLGNVMIVHKRVTENLIGKIPQRDRKRNKKGI